MWGRGERATGCGVVSYFPTPPAHVSMESEICILLPSSSGEFIPHPCTSSILRHSNLKGKYSSGVTLHFCCCCLEESEISEQCWMTHTTLVLLAAPAPQSLQIVAPHVHNQR